MEKEIKTSLRLPMIKMPGGEPINIGRMIRSGAGIVLAFTLIFKVIVPHDTIELVVWIGFCLILIDATLFRDAVRAWKGSKKE